MTARRPLEKRISLYGLATREVMGQQTYERHLVDGLRRQAPPGWQIFERRVRSMRSTDPGDLRLPLALGARPASGVVRRLIGLGASSGGVNHRLDLRIPPLRNEVVTVHDLAPLRFSDEGRLPADAGASLRRAAAVVAPSTFAAQEIEETFGVPHVHVVPNGVPDDLRTWNALSDAQLDELGIHPPFVLHVGGASQRKNLSALAGAWRNVAIADKSASLVLCGPRHPARTESFNGLPRVRLLSFLPRPTVVGLLKRAAAVVVPSLYEGFGIPALEAMALRRPAVVAQTSALVEVCGDGALMVTPSATGLASGILAALQGSYGEVLLDAGAKRADCYSWSESVRRYIEIYCTIF